MFLCFACFWVAGTLDVCGVSLCGVCGFKSEIPGCWDVLVVRYFVVFAFGFWFCALTLCFLFMVVCFMFGFLDLVWCLLFDVVVLRELRVVCLWVWFECLLLGLCLMCFWFIVLGVCSCVGLVFVW